MMQSQVTSRCLKSNSLLLQCGARLVTSRCADSQAPMLVVRSVPIAGSLVMICILSAAVHTVCFASVVSAS